ncbi:MAG: hypothetical protein WAW17_27800, partial [Rhodococcus sp. (in: high G+C Gram-positive bacteria)]|uniref:hypothetical protein n=1 Tax=Rhodococcus sp. TaxID=1831 RepID=UPI003BB16183
AHACAPQDVSNQASYARACAAVKSSIVARFRRVDADGNVSDATDHQQHRSTPFHSIQFVTSHYAARLLRSAVCVFGPWRIAPQLTGFR